MATAVDTEPANAIARRALRASNHMRRYMPLYVFGTLWAFMIVLLPTVNHHSSSAGLATTGGGGAAGPAAETGGADTGVAAAGAATGGGPAGANGAGGGGRAAAAGSAAAGPGVQAVQAGTGTTTGGVPCGPGVRQVPYSLYANPCVAKYAGGNGGATWNGVTGDSIKVEIRLTSDAQGPNAQAVNQAQAAAGQATTDQAWQYTNDMLPLFNKMYELYGRKVVLERFNGSSSGTDEAQSRGQETACADANAIANSRHAFGDVLYGFTYEWQPFAECAAKYKLYLPLGAAYWPEDTYYKRWAPYVWAGTMDCTTIQHGVAEYIGKRLLGRKAKWAGDPTYQAKNRRMATYVPNNPGYGHCADVEAADIRNTYHGDPGDRYDYALDVSQFASEAERGVIKFHAAGDTTIELSCDPISMTLLTQAAAQQNWRPEWLLIGVAYTDTDGYARLAEPSEVNGHLFGLSQLGSDRKVLAPDGEAARFYKAATGKDMPSGAGIQYLFMVQLFNQLQAAGPVLNPDNIAKGTAALPPAGGPDAAAGTWYFGDTHTAIKDSREVFWDPNATSFDGKKGDYRETYGGRRFQNGQWPAEEPPVYR